MSNELRVKWKNRIKQTKEGIIVGTYRENKKTFLIVKCTDGKIHDINANQVKP